MAKHLIYSDLHIKPENLAYVRVVHDAILAGAKKHGVIKSGGYVVNNGDLFNQRGLIHTRCLDELARARREWDEAGVRHIDNIGNHDQEDRDGNLHPLRIFRALKGSTVVEQSLWIDDLNAWFFPYQHGLEAKLKSITTMKRQKDEHRIVFVHAGIRSAWRNDKSQDTDGVPIEAFKCFDLVFSGHYHYRHRIQNVQYIGSPMQHTFAEMGQLKGYLIYDDETRESVFWPIMGTPRHFDLGLTWDDKGREVISQAKTEDAEAETYLNDTSGMMPGEKDIVRFTVTGPTERVRAVTRDYLMTKTSARSIKITREFTDATFSRLSLEEKDSDDVVGLMDKYVEHLEPQLDRTRLRAIGAELLGQ